MPGMRVYLQNPPVINVGGAAGARAVSVHAAGGEHRRSCTRRRRSSKQRLRQTPGLVDVSSDLQLANPQANVTLDRDRIAALGLTADQVESALSNAFSTRQVSTIYAPNNEYQVIMRVQPKYQQDPSALSLLYLQAPRGEAARPPPLTAGIGPLADAPDSRKRARPALERDERGLGVGRCPSITPASCRR